MSNRRTYTVRLSPLSGGGYMATVPALPGCATQGDSYEHALAMAQEAIQAYIAVLIEDGDPIPDEPSPHEGVTVGVPVELPASL